MKLPGLFLDLLFPPKCAFCARVVEPGGSGVCADCAKSIGLGGVCCKKKGDFFTLCVAPLYYEGAVRNSLLRYKFSHCTQYAKIYAPIVLECIERELGADYDILTWVPVSARRERERGYDQARLLAEAIGDLTGRRAEPLLTKVRDVPAQSGMGSAEKRRANISAAYRVISPEGIENKSILLIDDIVTTGATLSECAKTLLRSGCAKVMCAAVAGNRD